MNALSRLCARPWMILIVLIGFAASHAILLYLLRQAVISHAVVSGVTVSGVVLLVFAKHLGLFVALLRPLNRLFRHRSKRKSEDGSTISRVTAKLFARGGEIQGRKRQ